MESHITRGMRALQDDSASLDDVLRLGPADRLGDERSRGARKVRRRIREQQEARDSTNKDLYGDDANIEVTRVAKASQTQANTDGRRPSRELTLPHYRATAAEQDSSSVKAAFKQPKRIGPSEIDILRASFLADSKPKTEVKQRIARHTGLDVAQVNNCFQNARAKVEQNAKRARKPPTGTAEVWDGARLDELLQTYRNEPEQPSDEWYRDSLDGIPYYFTASGKVTLITPWVTLFRVGPADPIIAEKVAESARHLMQSNTVLANASVFSVPIDLEQSTSSIDSSEDETEELRSKTPMMSLSLNIKTPDVHYTISRDEQ